MVHDTQEASILEDKIIFVSGDSTNSTRPVPEPMEIEGTASSTTSLAPSIQSQTQCDTSCSTSAVPSCSTSAVDVSTKPLMRTRTLRSQMSQDEIKMGRTIKMLQKKMRYLLTQQKSYKKRLSVAKEVIKSTSFDSLTKKMTKTAKTFVEMQMTQASKQMRGRRFTLEQKILALSVYKSSPKAYRVLSQICILPKRKTLQCLLQKITLTPGINKKMFDHLSKRVKKMPDNHKYCAFIFDEMANLPTWI
ncbi:uncharacterized protein LOC125489559 [Plutella xylostella]|uniref:uncharacterized protein LOC125489559 n=1 Tax=Plutella xylostella TaxID=51655 RepID=UPI002032F005|nr:uncharacterized protein LOC125489559 [Plutella xylostella]